MSNSALTAARQLDASGLNVLPAKLHGKTPIVPWNRYQHERSTAMLSKWFVGKRAFNYWVACGRISGVLVLDVDSPQAEAWWREHIGDEMDATACSQTSKGHHYWFRISGDETIDSWGRHDEATGISFDVRAEGTGVIAPPSVHESGFQYAWVRDLSHLVDAPRLLRGPSKDSEEPTIAPTRSLLAELLSKPPRGKGGRNNWLTRVAGHYAKHFRHMEDAYLQTCLQANAMLAPPLDDDEFDKTTKSIWKSEQAKVEKMQPTEENGWLMPSHHCLLAQVRVKQGEEYQLDLAVYADFDIRALGVVEDDDANRTYDVEIHRRRQGDIRRALLPAARLARADTLNAWLAEFGVTVIPPDTLWPRSGTPAARLQRYLESQNPPKFRVVEHLGWHDDGFVCHEGVIRTDGLHGFDQRKPHPKLRNWAPYRYGFTTDDEARAILNEVLTFHDEVVCSVYGAWWAACFLKPQIHEVTSQFPFMALEAPSESGKTTGFFSLMLQLNGNTQGQVDPTRAALRDWISAHQSGIVWVDDLSDVSHLMDLLRQATGEGSVGKKGEDRTAQEVVRLVAPIAISGEALQLSQQKALIDRAIQLDVPSPTSRKSLRDPEQLQWVDVVALRQKHPDLTVAAGTMVKMALAHADLVAEVPKLAQGGGRFGDKIGVLRMGARLLADMTGDLAHVERVDAWANRQEATGTENTLTLKLLPRALAQLGWPKRPEGPEGRWPATPVFLDGTGQVWFAPRPLAQWWSEMQHGRIEMRTESEEALVQQARALGLGGALGGARRRFNLGSDPTRKSVYWGLGQELSDLVYDRSRGGEGRDGVHPEAHRLALWASTDPRGVEAPDE